MQDLAEAINLKAMKTKQTWSPRGWASYSATLLFVNNNPELIMHFSTLPKYVLVYPHLGKIL